MAHALIVDDDADVVDWLHEVARMEGFTVARALSLREARIELGRQRPDVLLTDLRLPDGEGIELVRELPRMRPKRPSLRSSSRRTPISCCKAEVFLA